MAIGASYSHVPSVHLSVRSTTVPCATEGSEHSATKCFLDYKNSVTYLTLITYESINRIYGILLQLRLSSMRLIEFVHLQSTASLIWNIWFIVNTTKCNWWSQPFKEINYGAQAGTPLDDSSGEIMVTGYVFGPWSINHFLKVIFWLWQVLLIKIPDQLDPLNMVPDLQTNGVLKSVSHVT